MARKEHAKQPLFYIQQPNFKKPIAPMQDHYTTPRQAREKHVDYQDTYFTVSSKGDNFKRFQNQHAEESADDQIDVTNNEETTSKDIESDTDTISTKRVNTRRAKFKDMTTDERIDYFLHRPTHVPQLKCEIATEAHTYRGIVMGEEKDEDEAIILMRTGRRTFRIDRREITEIRMLGM